MDRQSTDRIQSRITAPIPHRNAIGRDSGDVFGLAKLKILSRTSAITNYTISNSE
ncbi:hypothetical protein SLEP1_g47920 [Rubroshorea leprosula]|uniref:Uncharacterized protein n=1 Tax=Rubroshorea leprosula TaxID=152421 RepID=A0AAV5LUU5_9ROSI|nr:hypothetical protein SLEP1_g47920 [Rubroshorea leprosula]